MEAKVVTLTANRRSESIIDDWKKSVVCHLDESNDPDRLAEYALYVAKFLAYPELDIDSSLLAMDPICRRVAEKLKTSPIRPARPTFIIEKINECLFIEEKFKPNIDDYYNPLNSYLNIVLQRKTGIPITLCLLYIHVARSVNFKLYPVNFPTHFLVKHIMDGENGEIIVDPFNGGRIMDDYSMKTMLEQSFPRAKISLTRSLVERATPAQVVIRMLGNLKASYYEAQDFQKYETSNEMVLAIDPYNSEAVRDRGMLLLKSGRSREALDSLDTYLEINPEADDADEILDIIRKLRSNQP
jgi:regulator of sirC expression with transglutaminase-like and TPR domain